MALSVVRVAACLFTVSVAHASMEEMSDELVQSLLAQYEAKTGNAWPCDQWPSTGCDDDNNDGDDIHEDSVKEDDDAKAKSADEKTKSDDDESAASKALTSAPTTSQEETC